MLPQVLTDTNWPLIIFIILGSAGLAYGGDVLGFKYGKQRVSLFGLRPRYTSRLVTAFTGIFISVVVLTVMSFFSENVRAALFSMRAIQQETNLLTAQLSDAQDALSASHERLSEQQYLLQETVLSLDITRFDMENLRQDRDILFNERNNLEATVRFLRDEAEELRRDLDRMRLGAITVQANSLLAQSMVPPGTSREAVMEITAALKESAREEVAFRRSERRFTVPDDVVLAVDFIEESEIIARAENSPYRLYIRILAAENTALGDVVAIRFVSGLSHFLYYEGESIHRRLVWPGESGFNAEETLHIFLRELKNHAIRNGVRPDPATDSVGALDGEYFFEAVESLRAKDTPTIINAVALENIYTEGPVRIRILLE